MKLVKLSFIFVGMLDRTTPLPTHSPTSTPLPTNSPTTFDTVFVDVTMAMTAAAKASNSRQQSLKESIASDLSVSESQLEEYAVSSSSNKVNGVVVSYSWEATFHVVAPLSSVGFTSAREWSEDIESSLESTSFSTSATSNVGTSITVNNVRTTPSARLTHLPTAIPTPKPSLPTSLPSPSPTTLDTVDVSVSLVLSVVSKQATDKNNGVFLSTTADELGTPESALKHYEASSSQQSVVLSVVTYKWTVSFHVVQSLALTGSTSPANFAEDVEAVLLSDGYASALTTAMQTTCQVSSATAVVGTFPPTHSPTVTLAPTTSQQPTISPSPCLDSGTDSGIAVVDASLSIVASTKANGSEKDALLSSIATQINVAESDIQDFDVSSTGSFSVYLWDISFTVYSFLNGTGLCTGNKYSESLLDIFQAPSFTIEASTDVGVPLSLVEATTELKETLTAWPPSQSPTIFVASSPSSTSDTATVKRIPAAVVSGASLSGWATYLTIISGMVVIAAISVGMAAYGKRPRRRSGSGVDVEMRHDEAAATAAAEAEEAEGEVASTPDAETRRGQYL